MKQNVMVVFGGVSCEHDISIITAYQTVMNINTESYNIYPVYICKDGVWKYIEKFESIKDFYSLAKKCREVVLIPSSNNLYLRKNKSLIGLCELHCVINCMHGVNGEDGSMAGLLQLSSIPCTSSSLLGSILGIDKCAFKQYLKSSGIPLVKSVCVDTYEYFSDVKKCITKIEKSVGYPLIIKPARLGSSIGIKVCKKPHDLANFIENALKFDKKVLIEQYLEDIKEYNIAIYNSLEGVRVSSIESPLSSDEILSFNNKYLSSKSGGEYIVARRKTVKIHKKLKKDIETIAYQCYSLLECQGVVRFDFIVTGDDELYLNEVNTIPGSLANYLFSNTGLDFTTQLDEQIKYAIHSNLLDNKIIHTFESSVLTSVDLTSFNKYK